MYDNGHSEFQIVWNNMLSKHEVLHHSATGLEELMKSNTKAALKYFNETTLEYLGETLTDLQTLRSVA